MEEGKISSLLAALKLDENPLLNQFMYIEEHDTADGSFIIISLIKNLIEKNFYIILVLCQNSVGHFQALSRKIGYNLMLSRESGQLFVVNILEKIVNLKFYTAKNCLMDIYDEIKTQLTLQEDDKDVCIVVENLGNLIFVNEEEAFPFVGYLRTIALERKNCSLISTLHNFENCSRFELFTKYLRHFADVNVSLKGLQSGRANDITGHLIVVRKKNRHRQSESQYQYQLMDKSINIFAPGSRQLS